MFIARPLIRAAIRYSRCARTIDSKVGINRLPFSIAPISSQAQHIAPTASVAPLSEAFAHAGIQLTNSLNQSHFKTVCAAKLATRQRRRRIQKPLLVSDNELQGDDGRVIACAPYRVLDLEAVQKDETLNAIYSTIVPVSNRALHFFTLCLTWLEAYTCAEYDALLLRNDEHDANMARSSSVPVHELVLFADGMAVFWNMSNKEVRILCLHYQ